MLRVVIPCGIWAGLTPPQTWCEMSLFGLCFRWCRIDSRGNFICPSYPEVVADYLRRNSGEVPAID